MFKNSYQSGFLSLLYSIGSKPLQIWDQEGAAPPRRQCTSPAPPAAPLGGRAAARRARAATHARERAPPPLEQNARAVREGHVKRVTDEDIQGAVLELSAANIANVSVSCPADPTKTLGAARSRRRRTRPRFEGLAASTSREQGEGGPAPRGPGRHAHPAPRSVPHAAGIKLAHLTLLVKNQRRYFSFEVAVLDDMSVRRRFRASNYQASF
jgi:hypothetical protein